MTVREVCVGSYNTLPQAIAILGLLIDHGIKARISADDCAGLHPHLVLGTTGIRVMVEKEKADFAKRLILECEEDGAERKDR